jgi:hypothetical protein
MPCFIEFVGVCSAITLTPNFILDNGFFDIELTGLTVSASVFFAPDAGFTSCEAAHATPSGLTALTSPNIKISDCQVDVSFTPTNYRTCVSTTGPEAAKFVDQGVTLTVGS